MSKIQLTTLDNGLRIITDTVESVDSVALGVWAGVGTRNEDLQHNGIAHMVEHMLFKGTPTRNTFQIAEAIEDVGGHMNAYTSREITSYHIHLLKEHVPLAIEILADMYQHPVMPEDEVERERHVILQEIGMTVDTPDDLVFDNYYETAYPSQALGAPILGKSDLISSMKRDVLMAYVARFYTPARTVISAAGNIRHEEFVQLVVKNLRGLPKDTNDNIKLAQYAGGEHRLEKELEQSHIVVGFQGVSRLDPDYQAAQALSMVLGGGMSSRLFQEIREKRGLVYSIYSFHSAYRDSGQFAIYAGTGPKDIPELLPVVCEEILKITENLREEEVVRAKVQMKSNVLMGRESMMTRADQHAKYMLIYGDLYDQKKIISRIEALDSQKIKSAAQRIFASKPTLAAIGPLANLESYDKISKRLAA